MTEPFDDKSHVDHHVASSRAGKSDDQDGSYVGESSPDDAMNTEESGAEARATRAE